MRMLTALTTGLLLTACGPKAPDKPNPPEKVDKEAIKKVDPPTRVTLPPPTIYGTAEVANAQKFLANASTVLATIEPQAAAQLGMASAFANNMGIELNAPAAAILVKAENDVEPVIVIKLSDVKAFKNSAGAQVDVIDVGNGFYAIGEAKIVAPSIGFAEKFAKRQFSAKPKIVVMKAAIKELEKELASPTIADPATREVMDIALPMLRSLVQQSEKIELTAELTANSIDFATTLFAADGSAMAQVFSAQKPYAADAFPKMVGDKAPTILMLGSLYGLEKNKGLVDAAQKAMEAQGTKISRAQLLDMLGGSFQGWMTISRKSQRGLFTYETKDGASIIPLLAQSADEVGFCNYKLKGKARLRKYAGGQIFARRLQRGDNSEECKSAPKTLNQQFASTKAHLLFGMGKESVLKQQMSAIAGRRKLKTDAMTALKSHVASMNGSGGMLFFSSFIAEFADNNLDKTTVAALKKAPPVAVGWKFGATTMTGTLSLPLETLKTWMSLEKGMASPPSTGSSATLKEGKMGKKPAKKKKTK